MPVFRPGTYISKQAPPGFWIFTDWEIHPTPLGTDVGLADLSPLIGICLDLSALMGFTTIGFI